MAKQQPIRDPKGGLTPRGRRLFREKFGNKLKPGVKKKSVEDMSLQEMRRKGSWAKRFYGRSDLPPLVKPNGQPTRLALTAAAWGESVPKTEAAARRIARKGDALLKRYKREKEAKMSRLLTLGGIAEFRKQRKDKGLKRSIERLTGKRFVNVKDWKKSRSRKLMALGAGALGVGAIGLGAKALLGRAKGGGRPAGLLGSSKTGPVRATVVTGGGPGPTKGAGRGGGYKSFSSSSRLSAEFRKQRKDKGQKRAMGSRLRKALTPGEDAKSAAKYGAGEAVKALGRVGATGALLGGGVMLGASLGNKSKLSETVRNTAAGTLGGGLGSLANKRNLALAGGLGALAGGLRYRQLKKERKAKESASSVK